MFNGKKFGGEIVAVIRGFLDKRDADLRREIVAVRDRVAELEAAARERRP